jgi:hypothetical protein
VYHYATDTIGAVAVAIAVVLATALLLDRAHLRSRVRDDSIDERELVGG